MRRARKIKEHQLPFAVCGSKTKLPVQLADAVLFRNEKSEIFGKYKKQTLHKMIKGGLSYSENKSWAL